MNFDGIIKIVIKFSDIDYFDSMTVTKSARDHLSLMLILTKRLSTKNASVSKKNTKGVTNAPDAKLCDAPSRSCASLDLPAVP